MFTLEFSAESVGAYGIFLLENELRKYCDCSIRSKGGGWRWPMTAEAFKPKEVKIGGGNI